MKSEPPPMQILRGKPASPGRVKGYLARLAASAPRVRQPGSPGAERQALQEALGKAVAQLSALIARSEKDVAEILGVQIAMLQDDALSETAFDAIASGVAADTAWNQALNAEIAGYLAVAEENFRSRAIDLADMQGRVLDALNGAGSLRLGPNSILLADDVTPSRFAAVDWQGGGIVLRKGSSSSHVAMLARARNVPMIVGVGGIDAIALANHPALLDAVQGTLVIHPTCAVEAEFAAAVAGAPASSPHDAGSQQKPGLSADGQSVAIFVNLAHLSEIASLNPDICDGVGLVRTELLFRKPALAGEEMQFQAYRSIARWAKGRSVTLRTLDAGGDKPVEGLTQAGEANAFLGLRGVRLSLRHPEIFKIQLRAMARAAAYGDVRIMLPMVSVPAELAACRALLAAVAEELASESIVHRCPPLGIMVEVPAAAISIAEFDADFYSIGSNDLTQYVMAAARDNADVADLAECSNSAVLALIRRVVEHGNASGKAVSLCGDAAADRNVLPHVLQTGLRSLSVAPAAVGPIKASLAGLFLGAA